ARRIRCALTKPQSLLRLDKARVYLAGHQLIERPVPARMHLRGKFSQIRGFVVRTKTKSRDQVCRSCCDLISAGSKESQSHREALDLPTTAPDRLSSRRAELLQAAKARPLRQAQSQPAPVLVTALFGAGLSF